MRAPDSYFAIESPRRFSDQWFQKRQRDLEKTVDTFAGDADIIQYAIFHPIKLVTGFLPRKVATHALEHAERGFALGFGHEATVKTTMGEHVVLLTATEGENLSVPVQRALNGPFICHSCAARGPASGSSRPAERQPLRRNVQVKGVVHECWIGGDHFVTVPRQETALRVSGGHSFPAKYKGIDNVSDG